MENKQLKQAIEGNILMGMFYATCEQSEMLEKQFKQREKQIFKNLKKLGDKLFSTAGLVDEHREYLESITDVMHEAAQIIREKTENDEK